MSEPLDPLDIVDGRTAKQLEADGDTRWPDGTRYRPPQKGLDMITKEAPASIDSLFELWLKQGRPAHLNTALIDQLNPFSGAWLIGPNYCFRVAESGGRKWIEFERRSATLTGRGTGT